MKKSQIAVLAIAGLSVAGCSGMTEQQQRALSGGAMGAAGGAAIGALSGGSTVAGALIGGAAGTAAGLLYDQSKRK